MTKEQRPLKLILLMVVVVEAFRGRHGFFPSFPTQQRRFHSDTRICAKSDATLMADPLPNSIGNFFENKTDYMSFIQCYMLSMGLVDGVQYGVGFPVDMPVMLTYFDGKDMCDLRPVLSDYPDYDHLMNHVAVQLDSNEFQLYRTPVVLTLQGEFEDDEFNEVIPGQRIGGGGRGDGEDDDEDDGEDYLEGDEEEEEEDGEESEEISVAELVALEGIDDDIEESYDDDDDEEEEDDEDMLMEDLAMNDDIDDEDVIDSEDIDLDLELQEALEGSSSGGGGGGKGRDENQGIDDFWSSSPAGKMDPKYKDLPDFTLVRSENPDVSDIPADAFVTDEDTKSLRKAHRRADRIIEYAADVKLIASFHYKKKNFHLVRLLEPIFIVGKRIQDIKGYYFTLLDDDEARKVTPVLETLLAHRSDQRKANPPSPVNRSKPRASGGGGGVGASGGSSSSGGRGMGREEGGKMGEEDMSKDSTRRRSRRRWTNRPKGQEQP